MNNILITGAKGQLGNEMRRVALGMLEYRFFFTDVAELDITNVEAVNAFVFDNDINVVVNCAAYTNVDRAEDDVAVATLINCDAVGILADACAKKGAFFVHVSTDYVFDGSNNVPYMESDAVAPLGVYGKTKLQGEELIIASGCNYAIFRTSWLYSKHGNNFMKTMARLTAEKERLNVVFDQVGTPTFAGDLADVIGFVVGNSNLHSLREIFHFSNEGVCSWYDFAVEVAYLMGNNGCAISPCHSSEFPSKVTRPSYSVLDKTKVKSVLGVSIPYWINSLVKCINDYKREL